MGRRTVKDGIGPFDRLPLPHEPHKVCRFEYDVRLDALAVNHHQRLCDLAKGVDAAHGGIVRADEEAMVAAAEVAWVRGSEIRNALRWGKKEARREFERLQAALTAHLRLCRGQSLPLH